MTSAERAISDSRVDEILDRIAGTFARKGFDGSSMQDLAAAAGMSVGNFYRYYPSKIALIAALVERCACEMRQGFDAARGAPDPMGTFRRLLNEGLAEMSDEEAALWLQIDAASVVHPEVAVVTQALDAALRRDILSMIVSVTPGASQTALEDMADFMVTFVSSLFRRRAFEGGEVFAARTQRLTGRLFDMVQAELAAGTYGGEPLSVAS